MYLKCTKNVLKMNGSLHVYRENSYCALTLCGASMFVLIFKAVLIANSSRKKLN